MQKIKFLALSLLLVGCGKFHRAHNYYYDDSFEKEVQSYISYKHQFYGYKEAHYDITIKFSAFVPPKAGECETKTEQELDRVRVTKIISVDMAWWYLSGSAKRENLMFHELGHCDLDLDHVETYSIMYRSVLSSNYYESHRDTLIYELFHSNTQVSPESSDTSLKEKISCGQSIQD